MGKVWRDLVSEGQYAAVRWEELGPADQKAFLAHLGAIVPKIGSRYALPHEVGPELKDAAKILQLGELEASVEGDIPPSDDRWYAMKVAIAEALLDYKSDRAATGVNLAPAEHVDLVNDTLSEIDRLFKFHVSQFDAEDDQALVREAIASAAMLGFSVGQHTQMALHAPLVRASAGEVGPLIREVDLRQMAERELAASQGLMASLEEAQTDARRAGGQTMKRKAEFWHERAKQFAEELKTEQAMWPASRRYGKMALADAVRARLKEAGIPKLSTSAVAKFLSDRQRTQVAPSRSPSGRKDSQS